MKDPSPERLLAIMILDRLYTLGLSIQSSPAITLFDAIDRVILEAKKSDEERARR